MSEMIDRVARAMDPELWWGFDTLRANGKKIGQEIAVGIDISRDRARRAIVAMREPTPAMRKAGNLRMHETPLGNGQTVLTPGLGESGQAAYERMIDEALK